MSELKLPSQMSITTLEGKNETVYMSGENPREDGSIIYRSKDHKTSVVVYPWHKAVWP